MPPKRLWLPLAFFAAYVATVLIYVNAEQPVYIWDFKGYWSIFQDYGKLFNATPLQGFNTVLKAIRLHDYNPLPSALLFPFYWLFGGGRVSYILGIALLYLFPASCLTVYLFQKIFMANERIMPSVYGPVIFAAFLFVPFWGPTLRGYPDIVGIIPISVAIILVLSSDFTQRPIYKKAIILGLLLWAPFLFRRWYAYTIISLYLTLPLLNYFLHRPSHTNSLVAAKWLLVNFFIAGVSNIIAALALQYQLLKRILATDYSYIYSAYQCSRADSLHWLITSNGLLVLLLSGWGLLFCLMHNRRSAIIAVFLTANLIISFFLFTNTQMPGMHHLISFSFWLLLLYMSGLFGIFHYLTNNNLKFTLSILFSIVLSIIFISSLSKLPVPVFISSLFPYHTRQQKLNNLDNYFTLTSTLEQLTAAGDKFAVLASNGNLSDDLISTLSNRKIDERLAHSSQVDLADKIRWQAFMARYMVVADPIQIHLKPAGQRVVTIPAKLLLTGQGIGKAYKKLDYDFLLNNGIHAYIYEKCRPFSQNEVADFLRKFYRFYPQWKTEYANSLEVAMLSASISLGDVWGRFDLSGKYDIFAHPGQTRPTIAEINYPFTAMKIVSLDKKAQGDGVLIKIEQAGKEPQIKHIEAGKTGEIDLRNFFGKKIKITIGNMKNPNCDSVLLKPL